MKGFLNLRKVGIFALYNISILLSQIYPLSLYNPISTILVLKICLPLYTPISTILVLKDMPTSLYSYLYYTSIKGYAYPSILLSLLY